jgi:hypothetical protein
VAVDRAVSAGWPKEAIMEPEQWFKDRKIGEGLPRELSKVTPAALKTLQDKEIDRIIVLLAEVMAKCGQERLERPQKKRRGSSHLVRKLHWHVATAEAPPASPAPRGGLAGVRLLWLAGGMEGLYQDRNENGTRLIWGC